ncbi:DNA-processing protein DprA [Candidatus Woesearchaeota archaeon]|nr:DNA-processing protein DprA [Candidatus Woesearchaeota archaeon]
MEDEKIIKLISLKEVKGYGNKKVLEIVSNYKNLDTVFLSLLNKGVIRKEHVEKAKEIMKQCKNSEIEIITYFDKKYPQKLKQMNIPPILLFAKGDTSLLNKISISIVGTRKSSQKSIEWAYNMSKKLSEEGYIVVSGGAIGIDISAHKGILNSKGKTICVLGSGINNIYPKENEKTINIIMKEGLVISECPPKNNPNEFSLLERNRITSGLGDNIIIVSMDTKGGTISQYKTARIQKKKIFCPHPSLNLEPNEGIKKILATDNNIKLIKDIHEIKNYLLSRNNQKILENFV